MAIDFKIIPDRGLVLVRYTGIGTVAETLAATKAYLNHPDYAAGQKQFVDLSQIEGFENDYVQFMNMQAAKAERLAGQGVQSLAVYYAPTKVSQSVSAMFIRSWSDVPEVVALVQHTEPEALALLGQPEKSSESLLATLVK